MTDRSTDHTGVNVNENKFLFAEISNPQRISQPQFSVQGRMSECPKLCLCPVKYSGVGEVKLYQGST